MSPTAFVFQPSGVALGAGFFIKPLFLGLNTAAINRSLSPIGDKLPEGLEGHQAIDYAENALGTAYNNILPTLSGRVDSKLSNDLSSIVNNATRDYGLVDGKKEELKALIKSQIVNKSDRGFYDGSTLKDIQSNLGFQARRRAQSPDPDDKNLSDALFDAKSAFNDFIARKNPGSADRLKAIDTGWANFVRPQMAAERAKGSGVFTPAQLGAAVKSGGTRSQNATGQALMQDLSSAGQTVLSPTVPDSGTPFRHVATAGMALAGAGLGGEHLLPGAAEGAMGTAALGAILAAGGSKSAQAIMRAGLSNRPAQAAKLAAQLKSTVPKVTPGLVPLLLSNPGYNATN